MPKAKSAPDASSSERARGSREKNAVKQPMGRTDWARLRAMPEDEIERIAQNDPDNPPNDDWAHAIVGIPPLKTPVNAKFDVDVVDWFKAQGRGYQARMNAVLRRYMETHCKRVG